MAKRVVVAGLLGAVALMAWTFVVNGSFGFKARIDMNTLPAEPYVYEMLKEHVNQIFNK